MRVVANLVRNWAALLLAALLCACGGGGSSTQTDPASATAFGVATAPSGADASGNVLVVFDEARRQTIISAAGASRAVALAAPPAPVPDKTALRGIPLRIISYAYYNVFTCQLIEPGTLTTPTPPKYGAMSYGTLSLPLGGSCAGVVVPYTTAWYTWNTDPPSGKAFDTFTLHFALTTTTLTADTSWTIGLSTADPDGNQGDPDPDSPPRCHPGCPCTSASAPDGQPGSCTEGNPINTGSGNKYQAESDISLAEHTGLSFRRFYNSTDLSATSLGVGWRSEWDRTLNFAAPGGKLRFVREDGRGVGYSRVAGTIAMVPDHPDILSQIVPVTDASGSTTGWTVTRRDDAVESYSAAGRLLSVTTRSGRVTTLAYDAGGRLARITGPFGHAITLTYAGSNLAQVTAPDGGAYKYRYDSQNNLAGVTYPDGSTKSYVYDQFGLPHALTGIVDELGKRYATYTYDTSARALTSEHAGGTHRIALTYNLDGTVAVTNGLGFVRTKTHANLYGTMRPALFAGARFSATRWSGYGYEASGFLSSSTDWNGNVTQFAHDARGNEISRTEAIGTAVARTFSTTWLPTFNLPSQVVEPTEAINFTYDAKGNVLTRTESAGGLTRTWTFTYDAASQVLTATDPNGNTTSFAYDAQGALTQVTNALGQVTQIPTHDANGRPTKVIDPNGLVTNLSYDARGRLLSRNAGGLITSFTYDAAGNLSSVTQPDGSKLTMAYDDAHRLTSVTDRLGNKITYTLDAEGNRTKVSVFNASGTLNRTVSYVYDDSNRVVKVLGALNQATALTRDAQGNVLTSTSPVGAVSTMAYDALNRRATTTDANGGVTSLTYDPVDRVLSVTDPRLLTTGYSYNGFGDLLQIVSPDSGTTNRTFDANSNLLTSTDARGLTNTRAYDVLNRLISITYSGGHETYVYDAGAFGIGHLTQVSGNTDATNFTYDILGRLVRKQQTVGASVLAESFAFDAGGQLASITYPSGMVVGYSYDVAGQVAGLTVNGAAFMASVAHEPFGPARSWVWGSQTYLRPHDTDGRVSSYLLGTATRTLSYDVASRITGYTDSTGGAQTFGYDLLERLTSYTSPTVSQAYGYDADGNRTSLASGATADLYGIAATSNRLASHTSPATSYTYDLAGNLTAAGALSFSYDPLERMTASLSGGARAARTLYTTNGLGQRVQKSGPAGTTTFLYGSGSQLIGEYTAAASQETIYLEGAPVGLNNNGSILRVYADQLGAPRVIADATGATKWTWDGDPFGNVAPMGSLAFNQRFPGQYADAETGLYFNHARYYDPKVGRYTQSDPIGLLGGVNSYSYVSSGPLSAADNFGWFRSPDWMRAVIPGQVNWDNAVTSWQSGNYLSSFAFASEMVAEQLLTVASFGEYGIARGGVAVGARAEETALASCPPNYGFAYDPTIELLAPGTLVGRYGSSAGKFFAPLGTPAEALSLPPGVKGLPYSAYLVSQPLPVLSGTVLPWYGQVGLGKQYFSPNSIQWLLENGFLVTH